MIRPRDSDAMSLNHSRQTGPYVSLHVLMCSEMLGHYKEKSVDLLFYKAKRLIERLKAEI